MPSANSDWKGLRFPSKSPDVTKDMPFVINFCADAYTNKTSQRENAGIGEFADITLPLPRNLRTGNTITYSAGQTETTGGLFDMTTGGWWESLTTLGGLTTFLGDVTGWNAWEGERPMDERDSIFKHSEFRKHNYSWVLIPKNEEEGRDVAKIAAGFQTLAYPFKSDDAAYSRVIHPPIWHISVFDLSTGGKTLAPDWSNDPLPSVLTSVDIQTSGAAPGVYAVEGGFPAATKIEVKFQELEPAINAGKYLLSRSQSRGGVAAKIASGGR